MKLNTDDVKLLQELKVDIPPPTPERLCHKGICSMQRCSRCRRAGKFYKLLERLEREGR